MSRTPFPFDPEEPAPREAEFDAARALEMLRASRQRLEEFIESFEDGEEGIAMLNAHILDDTPPTQRHGKRDNLTMLQIDDVCPT